MRETSVFLTEKREKFEKLNDGIAIMIAHSSSKIHVPRGTQHHTKNYYLSHVYHEQITIDSMVIFN